MKTSTYVSSTNSLRELPEMEKPAQFDRFAFAVTHNAFSINLTKREKQDIDNYLDYLKSLRHIPCSEECRSKFVDGREYEEGKDYELREKAYELCHHCHDQGYKSGIEYACRYCNPDGAWRNVSGKYRGRKLVAFPLPVKGEDDRVDLTTMFNEFKEQSKSGLASLQPGSRLNSSDMNRVFEDAVFHFIEHLQSKYTITRKQ